MRALRVIALLFLIVGSGGPGWAQDVIGTKPLRTITRHDLVAILPPDYRIMIDPPSLEQFLDALDGSPPDWGLVYGHGHHESEHDERLFALNRERDAARAGREALQGTMAFLWSGELSRYEPTVDGFSVAMGPIFTPTRWGLVRFKAEDLPGNLFVILDVTQRDSLRRLVSAGQRIGIEIVMIGKLVPEESLIYDFSHEEEGRGLIMPVVRIERVEFLLGR